MLVCSYFIFFISCVNCFFFFQAEDGIRDIGVTGVQTCALPLLCRTERRWPKMSEREIVAFVDQIDADAALLPALLLDLDSPLAPRLVARFRDQSRDDAPPALPCDEWAVRTLAAQGYLSQRGPLVGLTAAGRRFARG